MAEHKLSVVDVPPLASAFGVLIVPLLAELAEPGGLPRGAPELVG